MSKSKDRKIVQMHQEIESLRADYAVLLEKHNNLHRNAANDRAENERLHIKIQALEADVARERGFF